MYPCDSNSLLTLQASGAGFIRPAQSFHHDFRDPFSLQGSASEYLPPIVSQPSYPSLGHDDHWSQAPQISRTRFARSSSLSMKVPLSLSSHPYHQAKLRQHAASAQTQGWSRLPFPTASAPVLDTLSPYNAVIGDSASTLCAIHPTPASSPQSNTVAPNTNENTPLSMCRRMVSGQTFVLTTPVLPSTSADQADIEYAQDRYGDRRCFYQCRFDLSGSPCNQWIVGDRTRVLRHLRNFHHLQIGPAMPACCRWEKCTHSRPMKQENLSRHVVMHLGVKWKCPHCRRLFSRDDAVYRHIDRMAPGMEFTDAEVVPGREAHALNESQCKTACTV